MTIAHPGSPRASRRKRSGFKKNGDFNFVRRTPSQQREIDQHEHDRLIREFINKHGVTRLPSAYSRMEW